MKAAIVGKKQVEGRFISCPVSPVPTDLIARPYTLSTFSRTDSRDT